MNNPMPTLIPTITPQPTPNCTTTHFHQQQLTPTTANDHWGEPVDSPKPFNTFQTISKNVSSLSTKHQYVHWKATTHAIKEIEANATSLQETNIAWVIVKR